MITQYWDDIVAGAVDRGTKTLRGAATGIRIGGPRPTVGKPGGIGGKNFITPGLLFAAACAFVSLEGCSRAAEIPDQRVMKCKVKRRTYGEFVPTGLNAYIYSPESTVVFEEEFTIEAHNDSIDEITTKVFNKKTTDFGIGYKYITYDVYSVSDCQPVKP